MSRALNIIVIVGITSLLTACNQTPAQVAANTTLANDTVQCDMTVAVPVAATAMNPVATDVQKGVASATAAVTAISQSPACQKLAQDTADAIAAAKAKQ